MVCGIIQTEGERESRRWQGHTTRSVSVFLKIGITEVNDHVAFNNIISVWTSAEACLRCSCIDALAALNEVAMLDLWECWRSFLFCHEDERLLARMPGFNAIYRSAQSCRQLPVNASPISPHRIYYLLLQCILSSSELNPCRNFACFLNIIHDRYLINILQMNSARAHTGTLFDNGPFVMTLMTVIY